ncbi:MAG: indolepyruvate oxidoreductase subunit beta [Methanomassiliicoccales archaeon]|nr:indolepyruvate oxidoreductase subunit beta [Methanomassiliicoccales archaeon]
MRCSILIVGVGGQGVLLASRVLGEAAMRSGHEVVMSEIHGMAQRGGSVCSMVRFGEGVISPLIESAGADVILAFEPSEACRSLSYANEGTAVITDVNPILPASVIRGEERYPSIEAIAEAISSAGAMLIQIDAVGEAEKAGSRLAANAVLLGALAGAEAVPLKSTVIRASLLDKVREKHKEMNARAFDSGLAIAKATRAKIKRP